MKTALREEAVIRFMTRAPQVQIIGVNACSRLSRSLSHPFVCAVWFLDIEYDRNGLSVGPEVEGSVFRRVIFCRTKSWGSCNSWYRAKSIQFMYAALQQIENLTVDVVAKESLRTIISLLSVMQIMTINEAKKIISEKTKLFWNFCIFMWEWWWFYYQHAYRSLR